MLFSSYVFLFLFLPVTAGVCFCLPYKAKNAWLLLTSLVFYGWNHPRYLLIMLASIGINYTAGLWIARYHRKKPILFVCVSLNLLLLFWFKYANFIVRTLSALNPGILSEWREITLPIGISFFTFQGLSYVIDVYRGDAEALRNPLSVGLYISFFPQLVAGPVVRFSDVAGEIGKRSVSAGDVGCGFRRFAYGFGKKIILADTFGMIADQVFNDPNQWNKGSNWIGIIAYALQIYYDFSGYSDMAIGLGRVFGFHFNENFNYPYISKSVTEFWRRWHISLSTWFRDYVYIPAGGSRVSRGRHVFNILLVWLLTGMWHGANWTFILLGIYYGCLLLIEKFIVKERLRNLPGALRQALTFLLVLIGWVLFRTETPGQAAEYLKVMFEPAVSESARIMFMRYATNYRVFWILGFIGIFPAKHAANRLLKSVNGNDTAASWLPALAENVYVLAVFALAVLFMLSGSYNAFIYFQF